MYTNLAMGDATSLAICRIIHFKMVNSPIFPWSHKSCDTSHLFWLKYASKGHFLTCPKPLWMLNSQPKTLATLDGELAFFWRPLIGSPVVLQEVRHPGGPKRGAHAAAEPRGDAQHFTRQGGRGGGPGHAAAGAHRRALAAVVTLAALKGEIMGRSCGYVT